MLNILSELSEATTIADTHRIREKYISKLPDNQKNRLEEMIRRACIRIRRIENMKKTVWAELMN